MTIDQLLALIADRQWTLVLAAVVWTATRYTKPDVVFPSLPARWRPLFAAAVAIIGAGASAVLAGVPLAVAGNAALEAFLMATMAHVFGVDVARNGKDLPVPGAKPPKPPAPEPVHISEIPPGREP